MDLEEQLFLSDCVVGQWSVKFTLLSKKLVHYGKKILFKIRFTGFFFCIHRQQKQLYSELNPYINIFPFKVQGY